MAGAALARPAGRVTEVLDDGAEREGAFRLLENDDVPTDAIGAAAAAATVRRAQGLPFVFAPVDGTSLQITDEDGGKRLGLVGARRLQASGLQVMSAIAVTPDGTPLGVLAQRYWARVERSTRKSEKRDTRPLAEKETRFWLQTMEASREAFRGARSPTRPWFQLDRGGDAGIVFVDGKLFVEDAWLTVRAEYDRRLVGAKREYLWERVESQQPCGSYSLPVVGNNNRVARQAHMSLRFVPVDIGVVVPTLPMQTLSLFIVISPLDRTRREMKPLGKMGTLVAIGRRSDEP